MTDTDTESTAPGGLKPLLDLAKARELLLIDEKRSMPLAGKAALDRSLNAIDGLIADGLREAREPIPALPREHDPISMDAWRHVREVQAAPGEMRPQESGSAYEKLKATFTANYALAGADGTCGWIESVDGSLPSVEGEGAKKLRADVIEDALSAVSVFKHRLLMRPEVGEWMAEVDRDPFVLTADDQRNFDLMKRQWKEETLLSEPFVDAYSHAITDCRAKRDAIMGRNIPPETLAKPESERLEEWFGSYEMVLKLAQEKAGAFSKKFGGSPYEAMIGRFENNPGLTLATVEPLFDELRKELPGMMQAITREQKRKPVLELPPVPEEVQIRVAHRVMRMMGLEEHFSRVDHEASSTFSNGVRDDIRITARPRKNEPMAIIMGLIHEAGHALYNHGLPRGEEETQPIGNSQSNWIHETQSIFWERQVAGSKEFMEHISKAFAEEGITGPQWSAENLFRLEARVKPGLIRVDADAVTYLAHVLLRHDLEKRLLEGTLKPRELPKAWNAGMKELLGVEPANAKEGFLQDTHWSSGLYGYFPSYALGILGAAQLMEAMKADPEMPDAGTLIRKGDFKPMRDWMMRKIHSQGSHLEGEALIRQATGKDLSLEPWRKDVQRRYMKEEPFPVPYDIRRQAGGGERRI